MRLKRLEMVGFKSFADKTRVEFEPGITAIVGPNGCGKSNISDAIRWALGEMSAKTLRSQHMMDVVFNGTANRPSQGMSEVALTFDNSLGQIPIDYTEVTIARRLFRSGESEYFINKTQCRLKDLRDLFLDTGVGNDGYYVMAQGKIEFILSAKPEERRELFEEAAGVSKYKARREEALRRLGKVDQDMLRLNDSLAIYKQQMDSLDAAVRKARTHQKLQDELRTLETTHLLHGYQRAQAEWETRHSEREGHQQEIATLQEELNQKEAALAYMRSQGDGLESQVMDLQKQAAQCESDWAKTEAERRAADERVVELRAAEERLGLEAAQLQGALEEWRKSLGLLEGDVEQLRAQFHEREGRYKDEESKGRGDQAAALEKQRELDQSKSRLIELVRLISHHRNETVRLTSLSIRQEEASKSKQRELEKVQLRRGALEEQLRQQENLAADAEAKLTTVQNTLRAIEELQKADHHTLENLQQTVQESRERAARLEAEKISLERWLNQDPVAQATAALRRQSLPGIYGPLRDLFKTGEPFQRLLDRALGDRADYFVAESLNDAQAAIRVLSEERQGWATFLVLDRLSQADPMQSWDQDPSSRSLAVQVNCDEKFRPVLQALLGKTYYVGATLFEEGMIRGGADPDMESYQARPGDLQRLLLELQELQNSLAQAAQSRETLQKNVAERENERRAIQSDQNRIQVLVQVQQESLLRLREDHQMSLTEEKLLDQEREEASQAIVQAQRALEQEEILLTTLESEEKTLQESVQVQDAALQHLRQTIQAHQTIVSQLRLEAETMRERLLGKERERENALRQQTSLEERVVHVQQETQETTERIEQVTALQNEKAALLETLRVRREEQQGALQAMLSQREQINTQWRQEEAVVTGCREALTQAQARHQEADFHARMLDQERQRLETALRDTYQLSVEEANARYGELQPDAEELARVKRRLENLGAVNLAAPEEHAQLEERYQFLLTQQQDLLKAKEDLHQAIAKINATTREQFRTTFDQVRGNFKQLYQTLFRGGEADVVLTDEHNILESGIDIMAQPPGKKLQNIALLSGGEKALTAIALLFAFFMVKPSPFCLLDEVDAPLDEANVGRFLQMVKSFAEKTQFIVITHNKRTMEMADVLYGVTMAELGISSLISVKLENAKPKEVVAA